MVGKVARNERCPCGSGKKYKQCCLRARPAIPERRPLPPASFVPRQAEPLHAQPRSAAATPDTQRNWQEVQAVLEQPSGETFIISLVYSREWLRSRGVTVGGPTGLNIPKYGVRGKGRVRAVRPSVTTPRGEGEVIHFVHLRKPEPEEQTLPPVEQRNWQQIHVRLDEPDGNHVYVVLLHSREWMNLQGIQIGGTCSLNLPQQKVRGTGRVALIEPSPLASDGEGRMMTFVRGNRKDDDRPDPLSRPGVRTYFGERLPPVDHGWLQVVLAQDGKQTSDLRLTRSEGWILAYRQATRGQPAAPELPVDVADWRLVRVTVAVQDRQKVHIVFFWPKQRVEELALTVDEPVLLRLPKEHLSGEGALTAIEPAPFVPGGDEPLGQMFISGKKGGEGKGTIETVEVGDYMVTYTQEERGDRLPIDDTQGKWVPRQRIRLHLDKEDGGHSKIVFLRDAKWVRTEHAVVGGTVYLNMPDMGCVGHARVEAIEPCLVFQRWGNSSIRMVTGTFAHSEGLCGDLKLKGESKPLGVTPLHPIWSEDRLDWVPAGELRPGETVKTLKGTTTVESYSMCDTPEPVYNMEVDGDHVYRVGDQGILVHNASCPKNTTIDNPTTTTIKVGWYKDGDITLITNVTATLVNYKKAHHDFSGPPWWDKFTEKYGNGDKWNRGHIIGSRFGGSTDVEKNLAIMYAQFNQTGAWKQVENRIADIIQEARACDSGIHITIGIDYQSGNKVVPSEFTFKLAVVDGTYKLPAKLEGKTVKLTHREPGKVPDEFTE